MLLFRGFHPLLFQTVVLALTHWCRGQPDVRGPARPIVAAVGDDATLPCHLEPPQSASAMTVEWTRNGPERRFVLVRRDGQELANQHRSYRGRTALFPGELANGNVSLKLRKVTPSDEGTYRCYFPGLDRDAAVKLVVGSVSSPVIHVSTNTSDAVVLQCESAGWSPEPELLWLDAEGNLLPAGPTETVRGADGLYTVSSTVTVEKRHGSTYTCRVQQSSISQATDAHITVADAVFPGQTDSRSSSGSSVPVIVGLTLSIMLVLAAAAALLVWKQRRRKHGKMQQDEETQNKSGADEPEQEPLVEPNPDREQVTTQEGNQGTEEAQTVHNLQTEPAADETVRSLVEEESQRGENICSRESDHDTGQFRAETEEKPKLKEEAQTVHNLQTEDAEAHDQCLVDEGQQPTVGRETLSDVDTEMDKFTREQKKNEKDEKAHGRNLSRLLGQKKVKEKHIKEIRKQLEEVETRRMDPDTQTGRDTEKVELQKQLEMTEEKMRIITNSIVFVTEMKEKATSEREQTAKKIEELQKKLNLKTTSDNRSSDQRTDETQGEEETRKQPEERQTPSGSDPSVDQASSLSP